MWRGLLFSVAASHRTEQRLDGEQVMLQLRTPPTQRHSADKRDPEALLQSVRHAVQSMSNESPEVVNGFVDSIGSALTAMSDALQEEHASAEQQLETQFAEIEACTASSSHGTAIVQAFDPADRGTLAACESSHSDAVAARNSACDEFDGDAEIARAAFPPFFHPASPASPTAEETADYMESWGNFLELELPEILEKKRLCLEKTETAGSQETTCQDLQSNFDTEFCDHRLACELLNGCYTHELGVYNALVAEGESAGRSRQAQARTLAQVDCLLGLIRTGVASNATIEDDRLNSCDDSVSDHLVSPDALTIEPASSEAPPACPSASVADPQCEEVQLPPSWEGGSELMTPVSCIGSAFIQNGVGGHSNAVCIHSSDNTVLCHSSVYVPYTGEAKSFHLHEYRLMCVVDTSDVAHFNLEGRRYLQDLPETVANVHMCLAKTHGYCVVYLNGTAQCWHHADRMAWHVPPTENLGLVKQLHSNFYANCAILQDDTLKCWGSHFVEFHEYGGIGVKKWSSSSAGGSCVIKLDDTTECRYRDEVIADIEPDRCENPQQTMSESNVECRWDQSPPSGLQVKDVNYGRQNICAIGLSDSKIHCWGKHAVDPPDDFGEARFLISFSSDSLSSITGGCAVMTSREVKCWGDYVTMESLHHRRAEQATSPAWTVSELC